MKRGSLVATCENRSINDSPHIAKADGGEGWLLFSWGGLGTFSRTLLPLHHRQRRGAVEQLVTGTNGCPPAVAPPARPFPDTGCCSCFSPASSLLLCCGQSEQGRREHVTSEQLQKQKLCKKRQHNSRASQATFSVRALVSCVRTLVFRLALQSSCGSTLVQQTRTVLGLASFLPAVPLRNSCSDWKR